MAGSGLDPRFVARALFVAAVVAGLFLLWQLTSVLLLVFAAIIVAVVLRTVADPLEHRLKLRPGIALALAGLAIVSTVGGAIWLAGALMAEQIRHLVDLLPNSVEDLRQRLATLPLGRQVADEILSAGWLTSSLNGVAGRLGVFAMTAVGAVTNLFLVLVAGVFLAVAPAQARDGLLLLAPASARAEGREALNETGRALRLWLLGTFADMLVVGTLTAVGAWIVGLPSPAALGLLVGLAAFVPIVGAIAGAIPGVLVAVQFGPQMILWTILMYVVVQQVEGNFVYPLIQRRAVKLPPVLTLIAVVAFGVLFGTVGIIFATPLLVVIYTLVRRLYIHNTLGEPVAAADEGEQEAAAS
jgi:predicted PurR-regulated permease PerM